RLLFLVKPFENAPCLDGPRIGVDVGLPPGRKTFDIVLLRVEDFDVFQKRRVNLIENPFRYGGKVVIEIMRLTPEIVRGGLRLRRYRVEVAHGDAADTPAFWRTRARRCCAHVEAQETGRQKIDNLPTIHIGRKTVNVE